MVVNRILRTRVAVIVIDYISPDTSTYAGVYVNVNLNNKEHFFTGVPIDDYAAAMDYARSLSDIDEIVLNESCEEFVYHSRDENSPAEYAFDVNYNLTYRTYYGV